VEPLLRLKIKCKIEPWQETTMSNTTDHLATLHTAAIDARNGYREAANEAEGKGLSPLFEKLAALHDRHAAQLSGLLSERGQKPDKDGSFMSVVHRTIMDVRSLFGGLDDSVIPGLIDGEKRNIAKYDDALKEPENDSVQDVLAGQRAELSTEVDMMTRMKPTS
jgi:uncharacterized protein (TIGR02284 family)